jgi:hypothetical protein
MTFTLTVMSCSNNSELNLYSACINACISLINRSGINQKQSAFAAMTLQIRSNDEVLASNFVEGDLKSSFIEMVTDEECNVMSMETLYGTNAID